MQGQMDLESVVKMNKSALVAHLITVVWCREDCDALASVLHLVPFVLAFVCPV